MNLFAFAVQNARREFRQEPPMFRDPIEADPFVIQQRADEAIREQRWNDFIEEVKRGRVPVILHHVIALMEDRPDWHYEQIGIYTSLRNFAETEGWHGVLSAIARALREAQHQAEEMERRR